MKLVGLPISLWDLIILRRVGEECGGFLAIDPQTEKLEELQWARILVKTNDEELPNVLEIGIEEVCYSLSLWWEIRQSLRKVLGDSRGTTSRPRGEVEGEAIARIGPRVVEEKEDARLEVLHQSTSRTGGQVSGSGRKKNPSRNQVGSVARPSIDPLANGPPPLGPSMGSKGSKLAGGLFLPGPLADLKFKGAAADEAGPSSSKAAWWVDEVESISTLGLVGLEGDSSPGPSQSHLLDRAQSGKACPSAWHGLRSWNNPEAEFLQL